MKKKYFKKIVPLICIVTFGYQGFAQAPANDDCAGAINIPVAPNQSGCAATTTTANTTTATTATYTTACWTSSFDDDVWYKFTAPATQIALDISNLSVAAGSVGYSIFTGSCTGPELTCVTGSSSVSGLTIGQIYYISIFYRGTTNVGTFDICLYQLPPPPPNDNSSGAIAVSVAPDLASCIPTSVNTSGGTNASYTSACWSASYDDDVWYKFTAVDTLVFLNISNKSIASGFVGYAVFQDSCTAVEFICEQDSSGAMDSIGGLTIGKTYYISIFYSGMVNRGTFDLCLANSSTAGISSMDAISNSLQIYPNPVADNLTLSFKTGRTNNLSVQLFDVHGKEAYIHSENSFSGEFNKTLDVKNLSKGIYLLRIISDQSAIVRKVVIK